MTEDDFRGIEREIGTMLDVLLPGRTFVLIYHAYDEPPYARICATNAGTDGPKEVLSLLKSYTRMFEMAVENGNVHVHEGRMGVIEGNKR